MQFIPFLYTIYQEFYSILYFIAIVMKSYRNELSNETKCLTDVKQINPIVYYKYLSNEIKQLSKLEVSVFQIYPSRHARHFL